MAVIFVCPTDHRLQCPWKGVPCDIAAHFEKHHCNLLFRTNSIEIDLNTADENRLLSLKQGIYLVQSSIRNKELFIRLRHLGTHCAASKITYDLTLIANSTSYKYDMNSSHQCFVPNDQGWQIDLSKLEELHGQIQLLTCQFLIQDRRRKQSHVELKINNSFIENYECDDVETKYFDLLQVLDGRIDKLQKRKSDDFMDKISLLNLAILEDGPVPKDVNDCVEDAGEEWNRREIVDVPGGLNLFCATCKTDMLPPIFVCTNGHNVCVSCRGLKCGQCDENVTESRNTDLENVSRTHKHPCRYSSEGCTEQMLYNEIREHEIRCRFTKYKCPDGCRFEGKFDNFEKHLRIVHGSVRVSDTLNNEFPKNAEFFIANRDKGIFHCKSQQCDNLISWRAVYCGSKERLFFCELNFKRSKLKEPMILKRNGNKYELMIAAEELKKLKIKEKYAVLNVTSYDN